MRSYYDITNALRNQLEAQEINTVTTGTLDEVDLNKETIYPLAHLIIENGRITEQAITFDCAVIFADVVDYSPKNATDLADPYHGNDNRQDVLNAMLAEANILTQKMIRGVLFENYIQVTEADCEPFYQRFTNDLAGWVLTFTATAQNTEICV